MLFLKMWQVWYLEQNQDDVGGGGNPKGLGEIKNFQICFANFQKLGLKFN